MVQTCNLQRACATYAFSKVTRARGSGKTGSNTGIWVRNHNG